MLPPCCRNTAESRAAETGEIPGRTAAAAHLSGPERTARPRGHPLDQGREAPPQRGTTERRPTEEVSQRFVHIVSCERCWDKNLISGFIIRHLEF
jgi:hypothetical protein